MLYVGRNKANNMWQKLSTDLNACGPPERDVKGWKKVWADYKNYVKVKCRRNRTSISGIGGGPSRFCSLTPLEQQTCDLLLMEEAVRGMSGTLEFGANSHLSTTPSPNKTSYKENNIDDEEEDVNPDLSFQDLLNKKSTPQRPTRKVINKDALLEKQVENQITYQNNSIKVLKEVSENLAGVQKYLKRSSDTQERRYKIEVKRLELEKEKLELAKQKFLLKKEKFEYKKKNGIEKSKIRLQQLEMKKSILDIKLGKRNV